MEEQIKKAIESISNKAGQTDTAIESQQYAQAVLSLSNALIGLRNTDN